MSLRTFYLTNLVTPADLVELQNALRIVLDLRFIVQDPTEATITIRAPQSLLDAAAQIIASINVARPEVLLDMNVYEVSYSLLRQLGNNVNTQWTLTNITPALVASLTGGASTNLINQLISSGGINQGNSQAIQALLSQLQQSNQSSLLSTPMATFGGGLTLFGLAIPGFTVNLNLNESDVRSLQHVILRTTQNNAAIMKIGERYPIINATYAPIYNSAAISQVLGNQSYIAPFPSFNFEDLGLNLKATPMIHSDKSITLKMELQIRSLGTATNNGQPIINNREYNGTITLKDGEEGLVAGLISKADSRSLMGGLSYAISEHDKNVTDDDLLVVITPHIIRLPEEKTFALQLPVGH
jgi:general secretion pathway protein D